MTDSPIADDPPEAVDDTASATNEDENRSRRRPLIAIAGVFAVVAVAALVPAFTGGDDGDGQNITVDDATSETLAPTGEQATATTGDNGDQSGGETGSEESGGGDDDDPDDADDDSSDSDSERTDVGASRPAVVQPFRCSDEPDRCLDRFEVDGFDGLWNIGGGDFTDVEGHRWSAASCAGGNTYESPNEIDDTDDDELFQARRFEPSCSFPVEPGLYEVLVGWAETYDATPGYRVFPLVLEGRDRAIVDVGRAVGMNRPFIQSYEVNVVDERLDVAAPPQENRSMLAAVAYRRIGDPLPASEAEPAASRAIPLDRPTGGSTDIAGLAGGETLTVGAGADHPTLQEALEDVQPGQIIKLVGAGPHPGPVRSVRSGSASNPIVITAEPGAYLECPSPNDGEVARCFQLGHSSYRIVDFAIVGGSSNLYMVGDGPGEYVTDVKVLNSVFRGSPAGGTGECIRVKYQASAIEIAGNDIADCGLGKCCNGSKNGEGVYVGTAPEQLKEKNPTPERDETTDVWIHHNTIRSLNECVEAKEAVHSILVEYNSCKGQADTESGAFGSRGGLVGRGNVFRFNLVESAEGACIRFGGDDEPDGTGNDFYGNVCRDISGEYGVKQQRDPQGLVCGNVFGGSGPSTRLSRNKSVDPTAACPAGTPTADGEVGAGRPNEG